MGYYKVKNITKSLAKRDMQKDKDLTVTLNDGLFPSDQVIESGGEFLIHCTKLPTELQKLRVKGLVTIVEVGKNEFLSKLKESEKPKKPTEKKETKTTTTKKPTTTSDNDDDSSSSKSSSSKSSSSKSTSSSKKKSSSNTTEIISEHLKD